MTQDERSAKGRRAASRGYTLVEVVVSLLITSIVVSGVFSVALTTRGSGGKSERKLVASQAMRELSSTLKNYQKAAGYTTSDTTILGPNSLAANRWSLEGGSTGVVDSCSGGTDYALATGCTHGLTGFLPPWFESQYQGTISYTVSGNPPQVNITVDWTDP